MPNYGLVVTPTYNPISYEQYVAPFREYAQVYNTMAEAFDTLETEASVWEKLKDSPKDSPQYQAFLNYSNDLGEVTREMAEHGLTSKLRGKLSEFRRRYGKEIQPISEAWERREEQRKVANEIRLKNPYAVIENDPYELGLSTYMSGTPTMNSVDLATIRNQVMQDASALTKEEKSSALKKIFGGQYYEQALKYGFGSEAVRAKIQDIVNNPDKYSTEQKDALATIVMGAVTGSGVTSWEKYQNDPEFRRRVLSAAADGLWQAVGTTQRSHVSNKQWDLNSQAALARRQQKLQQQEDTKLIYGQTFKNKDGKEKRYIINPTPTGEMQYIDPTTFEVVNPTDEGFDTAIDKVHTIAYTTRTDPSVRDINNPSQIWKAKGTNNTIYHNWSTNTYVQNPDFMDITKPNSPDKSKITSAALKETPIETQEAYTNNSVAMDAIINKYVNAGYSEEDVVSLATYALQQGKANDPETLKNFIEAGISNNLVPKK